MVRDSLGQPVIDETDVEHYARVWANLEGSREAVEESITNYGSIAMTGFSILLAKGHSIRKGDKVVSIMVSGEEWLQGNPLVPHFVRGVERHVTYDELLTETTS